MQLHRHNRHGYGSFNMEIDENNDNYINITCTDDQKAADISDNSTLIETNTSDISSNKGLIETNTSDISSNKGLIETNTSDISSNKGLIETNTSDIAEINELNKNIKSFYNLEDIFIYDIKPDPNNKVVNKDNHFHVFEKEITYDFIKNSYLEISLKVLTELSNYTLIGYFQVLCNFCDQDDNLFYTISLSTAMGSINRLSTIKSVFIVPINENMSKIKIDFFIEPKPNQQHRTAKFIVRDINSNKIYIKYFQKTNEMSIKSIQDSLDAVKDISNDLEQINTNKNDIINLKNNIKLKNIYNILFYNEREQIDFKNNFFNKTYEINIKKDDFIEIDLRMLLEYENIDQSNIIKSEIRFYNDDNEKLYAEIYDNSDFIPNKNFVFLNKYIFYNFEKDTTKLRILIYFWMIRSDIVNIWYEPKNTDRFILKHYSA